jgi:predicted aspartyl protease
MRVFAILCLCAASAFSFGPARAAAATLVPFDDVYGSIVVRIVVDGKGPYDFAVDTGSWEMVVTPDLARELALPATGRRVEGGAGPHAMSDTLTRLSSAAIGALIVRDLPADEVSLPDALVHRAPGITIRGLVGFDFLRRFVTTIDYSNSTLRFDNARSFVAPRGAIVLPMYMVAGGRSPGVPASVDGHAGVFMLDTGDSGWPFLKASFAASTSIDAGRKGKPMSAAAAGGDDAARTICLQSFALSDWSRRHVPAYVDDADQGVSSWTDHDGSIGYETLRPFRTSFDFARKAVYLDPVPYPATDYATEADCLPV